MELSKGLINRLGLMTLSSILLTSVGCGGGSGSGSGGSAPVATATVAVSGCSSIELKEEVKNRVLSGMTVQQANVAVGCEGALVGDDPVTYEWSNDRYLGFGVNLSEDEQVVGIFDNEDLVKCPSIVFTTAAYELVVKDLPISQVDVILGCEGQVKSIDYDLLDGTNFGMVQYINDEEEEINVFFENDLVTATIKFF